MNSFNPNKLVWLLTEDEDPPVNMKPFTEEEIDVAIQLFGEKFTQELVEVYGKRLDTLG